ncbi:MAG TPA: ATP-binding protein [Stellaceae bacterium]|jgi:two-component system nitrogen regulation sensor histidine kinase GlnL|nr:ATP-binding protein [Stellaceae bacterium]
MIGSLRRRRSAVSARARAAVAAPVVDIAAVLAALPNAVIALDRQATVRFVNPAAEQFFSVSAAALIGNPLDDVIVPHSPLFSLAEAVWHTGGSIAEYDVMLEGPRFPGRVVTIQGAPAGEGAELLVLALHERSMADKMDRQLTHRNAARSVTAMAAMLAHEVKNPLSGIRGAAQLLEQDADEAGRELTQLICDETDRIVALVDRMEAFSEHNPITRAEVNIHEVLDRVRKIAQSGFARHVRLNEEYDPSLPPVLGDRDLLLQVFLNLIKNAAEAVPGAGGEIVLTTAYRHGLRLAAPGSDRRRHLPLMVSVTDNGGGIPDDLKEHLFDPFVTTKRNGTGLGLALVAKVIGDHGGVIEFDSQPRRTVFRVFLPVVTPGGVAQNGSG